MCFKRLNDGTKDPRPVQRIPLEHNLSKAQQSVVGPIGDKWAIILGGHLHSEEESEKDEEGGLMETEFDQSRKGVASQKQSEGRQIDIEPYKPFPSYNKAINKHLKAAKISNLKFGYLESPQALDPMDGEK